MSEKFYITTAIPYVNARPHIGFALEIVQADVLARYHREAGDKVFFLTGTDENSLKNVQAAEKEGITPQALCDNNSQIFHDLKAALNLSFDGFIRTTEQRHFAGAQKLWQACNQADIYKKKYRGFYCVGCESFYTEKDLIDGKCSEHQTKPDLVEEKNYFFKLSYYQDKLLRLIESDEYKIVPETKKNEIVSFIKMGLEDFSISRSVKRAHNWGVPVPSRAEGPVPGDDSQIMYVWFDALANYITALDYHQNGELFKKFWPANVHVIGKGVIRFHAVYWPAMLMSAGLALPKELFVHGYINVGGEKMSKSLGNVVDPFQVVKKYGTEAVRYYLLKQIHPFEDSDFTIEKFEETYNADLANGLGNLVSRTSNLIEKNFGGSIKIKKQRAKNNKNIEEYRFDLALKEIQEVITSADQMIDKEKPWELVKMNTKKAEKVLADVASQILLIAEELKPFLPATAEKIIKQFTAEKIVKGESLFPRI